MFRKLARIGALAAVASGLIGMSIGTTAAQDGTKICFGFQDLETEFWVAGHRAITDTLTEQGVEVLEYNANEDPNRQLEQIRECIAQGVDGIIIIPQDGDSAVTIVNEAQAADIPIAVFNRPPNDRAKGLIVVADNVSATEQAVEFIAQKALRQWEITQEPITPLILVRMLPPEDVGHYKVFFLYLVLVPWFCLTAGRSAMMRWISCKMPCSSWQRNMPLKQVKSCRFCFNASLMVHLKGI